MEEAIHWSLRELEKVTMDPLSEVEVERAKKYLVGSFEIGRQTVSDQNAEICFNELYGLGHGYGQRYVQMIEGVTPRDVLEIARKYLRLDAYTLTLLRPEKA
jgi:zinc protease